jgi:peptidoglycan/LPS O-acetylase OafA/YrhL
VGYLLSAVTLAWATDLEHGLGTFLVSLCQTLFLASILLYVVSKPGRRAARRAVVRVVATAR